VIKLKKTAPPCSYSGAFAAYDVLKDGIKVGELFPKTSRLCDGGPYHELRDLENHAVCLPVAVRGPFRKTLNEWGESQNV
jgi:hypothetical protein